MPGGSRGSPIDLTAEVATTSKRKQLHDNTAGGTNAEAPAVSPNTKRVKTKAEPGEGKRLRPFRKQAPKAFDNIWFRATTQRFFVLKRTRCDTGECPEEEFELAGTTGNVYTVRIARQPSCNCPIGKTRQQCKHTVYVLHRVLRARYDLVYQLALLTTELREIFQNAPYFGSPEEAEKKNRKDATGEDCPICYVEFKPQSKEPLVWCRAACGQNFHKLCFDTWAKSCGRERATCPICRSKWEGDDEEVAASVSKDKGIEREGYVNVASQLGINGVRDTSTYSRWSRFGDLGQRYYN